MDKLSKSKDPQNQRIHIAKNIFGGLMFGFESDNYWSWDKAENPKEARALAMKYLNKYHTGDTPEFIEKF